jgi:hypothetical protein
MTERAEMQLHASSELLKKGFLNAHRFILWLLLWVDYFCTAYHLISKGLIKQLTFVDY